MTTTDVSPYSDKLTFNPSLQEQLLLPKVHDHNLLMIYSSDEALIRIQSLIILYYLSQPSDSQPSRVLILTKRNQQQKFQSMLKNHLILRTIIHNGSILPYARKFDYHLYRIIFSTPRTIKNDLMDKFFHNDHFSLIIINQSELGSSSSSLRFIINKLSSIRVVGFTLVTNPDRLKQVCKNLQFQEVAQVEEHVLPTEKSHIQHYSLPLPQEFFFVLEILDQIKTHELDDIGKKLGFDVSSKSTIREITAIHESLKQDNNPKALIRVSNLLRIMNLQKMIISQGFSAVDDYFNTLKTRIDQEQDFQGKSAAIGFLADLKIQKLSEFISIHKHLQHPKVHMLLKLISQYNTGISIVSHNYYNSSYLKDFLDQQAISVIQISEPLSSMTELNLQRVLLPFTEKKVNVCITNAVNTLIARNAQVIIAYDVNAGIVEALNNIEVNIPRVFLLAKQTNEEARFFYLKRLGSSRSDHQDKIKIINEDLTSASGPLKKTRDSSNALDSEKETPTLPALAFNPNLFELGIPYLLSQKEYSILSSNDISFPGFILDQRICFLLLIPKTIDFFLSTKPSQFFNRLAKEFTQTHLIIYSHSFDNLSFNFQCDLLHAANRRKVWITFLTREEDIPILIERVLDNPNYSGDVRNLTV
ncbi:MAG: hypothetical protein ACFFC6_05495 [Promethearchaeota archaeon]